MCSTNALKSYEESHEWEQIEDQKKLSKDDRKNS
jgi:hypothetical protein